MFNYVPLEEELVFADLLHEVIARLDTIRLHIRLSHGMPSLIRRGLLPTTSTARTQALIISMHIPLRMLEHSTHLAPGTTVENKFDLPRRTILGLPTIRNISKRIARKSD